MQDQHGGLDRLRVRHRRAGRVKLRLVPVRAVQVLHLPARRFRIGEVGDEGKDPEGGDGGLESVRLRDRPVRQITAVGAAHDPQSLRIGDPLGHRPVHARDAVLIIAAAQISPVGRAEGVAVALAAPVIGRQHDKAVGRIDLSGRPRRERLRHAPMRSSMGCSGLAGT